MCWDKMKRIEFKKAAFGIVLFVACLFIVLTIYGIKSKTLPVEAELFICPTSSATSWNQVFEKPASIKMERYDTGTLHAKKSGIINLKHPKAKGMIDEDINSRVFSYLIHHEKFGDYLVDAGLGASIQENPYGNVKGLFGKRIRYSQKKGMDIVSRLKGNVILKGIFLTHLHYDHTSGLAGLPSSLPCYICSNETYMNYKFLYENDCLNGFNHLIKFDFSEAKIMEPLGPALDIFGDGSFWAVSTPGHTEGHVSFLVNGKEDLFLILGDASIIKHGLDSGIGPGTYSSDIELLRLLMIGLLNFIRDICR